MQTNSVFSSAPHPTTSFYNTCTTSVEQSPDHWCPGEFIDVNTQQSSLMDFHSLVSTMQSSISSHFNKLDGTLSTLTSHLEKLEEGVAANTAKLNVQPGFSTPQSTFSSSSCESSGGGSGVTQRKRSVPTGLAVSSFIFLEFFHGYVHSTHLKPSAHYL